MCEDNAPVFVWNIVFFCVPPQMADVGTLCAHDQTDLLRRSDKYVLAVMILSAVSTVHRSLFLSCFVAEPNQTVKDE